MLSKWQSLLFGKISRKKGSAKKMLTLPLRTLATKMSAAYNYSEKQNSSVFLSNSTIWVEGITDRRYVSHYLDLYQNHLRDESEANSLSAPRRYRQDLHYSFVEYAGATLLTS